MSSRALAPLALAAALACGAPDPAGARRSSLRPDHAKVTLRGDELASYEVLREAGAIARELDYGAFKVLEVERARAGTVPTTQELVRFNGLPIDPRAPDLHLRGAPPALVDDHLGRDASPPPGLYVVQLVGPVRDAWLEALGGAGLELVQYVPDNAYVVRADARAAGELRGLLDRFDFVQLVADYEPIYRLAPELRAQVLDGELELYVELVAGPKDTENLARVAALAKRVEAPIAFANYLLVPIVADAAALPALARLADTFAVDRRERPTRNDERQGQIMAGNVTGGSPSGPGYLAWLASKGFDATQFGTFAVEVVDDSHDLSGHPDLPAERVAFQNNPTNADATQGGHGHLNAHIVGGFNSGTGSAVEDAAGYNYGLGIAPWARVGVTDIFGGGSLFPNAWENAAYLAGARISSNSWGFNSLRTYSSVAQLWDILVRDGSNSLAGNQALAIVFSAGNNGSAANAVSSPGLAKNVLTVGASESERQEGTDGCGVSNAGADDARDIASFSSRGPVNPGGGDGRTKPDLVAPGTHIEAGIPQSNYVGGTICNQFFPAGQTLYGWSSGTSHSCPAVSGAAALLRQHFLNGALPAPSPAMIKAYLGATARYLTGVGANDTLPSNSQGMGHVDLARAFDDAGRLLTDETTTFGTTGQTFVLTGVVESSARPFRVGLAWTDRFGPSTGAPWINDLDLSVTVGGSSYLGNVFSGASSTTGGAADGRNNSEYVFLPAGVSGPFTITITAANIAGDGVPGNADTTDQDFALVVYNATGAPTISASPGGLSFSATAGGANPPSQDLSIANTGGGTLNWSLGVDQPWLLPASASGVAPSTQAIFVDIDGLAPGSYSGNLTLTDPNANNSPVTVPVTLDLAAPAIDAVANGGFEDTLTPWILRGSSASLEPKAASPASGRGDLRCGSAPNDTSFAYQTVTVPAGATLGFALRIASAEASLRADDRLDVELRDAQNALLATVASFSNLDAAGYASFTPAPQVDLSSFAAQTVRLFFRCSSDAADPTAFYIDDVSIR